MQGCRFHIHSTNPIRKRGQADFDSHGCFYFSEQRVTLLSSRDKQQGYRQIDAGGKLLVTR